MTGHVLIRTSMGKRRDGRSRNARYSSPIACGSIRPSYRLPERRVSSDQRREARKTAPSQSESLATPGGIFFKAKGCTCARLGPDELIDHGEIDELVSQTQYILLNRRNSDAYSRFASRGRFRERFRCWCSVRSSKPGF